MGNTLVESQLNEVKDFLSKTVINLEDYLNETSLKTMKFQSEEGISYYKLILTSLRKLVVYCEEGYEACTVILNSETFQKAAAEKILYRIYHQCIEEFFSPKNDSWFEDSRSAYTGKNSIKFYKEVPDVLLQLVKGLESDFQRIREELEYYETDYRTKMMQSK